jgi:hypothetical protein
MTPNESPAALLPARWYVVTNYGAATLCLNEADARKSARQYDRDWPKNAPHVAVQLAPVANESRGSVPVGYVIHIAMGEPYFQPYDAFYALPFGEHDLYAAPTPPAVASGEPTAEQWRSAIEACFCGSIDDAEWSRITALARSAAAEKPR